MGGLWHVVVFYARCLSIIIRGTPPFLFRPLDYSDFWGAAIAICVAGATYFARAGISLTHPSSGVPFPLLRFGVPFTQIFGPRRGLGGWCATRLARHLAGGTARVRCPFSLLFLRKTRISGYHAAFPFYTWASERVPAFLAVILGVHLFYSDFGWALLRFFLFRPGHFGGFVWEVWYFWIGITQILAWHYSDFFRSVHAILEERKGPPGVFPTIFWMIGISFLRSAFLKRLLCLRVENYKG